MSLAESLLDQLADGEAVVLDGILGPDLALAVAQALRDRLPDAAPARLGTERELRPDLRNDVLLWLQTDEPGPIGELQAALRDVRDAVAEGLRVALPVIECQAACYPGGGARYARHRDAFEGVPGRRITAIWYANPDWEPAHGGQLRIYGDTERDIEPLLDRLLLFRSDLVLHEVMPAWEHRWAVTAWFGDREPPV